MGIAQFTIYRRAAHRSPGLRRNARVRCHRMAARHRRHDSRPEPRRVLHTASTDRHICREPHPELDRAPFIRPVRKNCTILDTPARYGAHSLRAGFVTEAFRAGATHHEVMRQTGHRSVATAEGYPREPDPLWHNALMRIGL